MKTYDFYHLEDNSIDPFCEWAIAVENVRGGIIAYSSQEGDKNAWFKHGAYVLNMVGGWGSMRFCLQFTPFS